MGTFLKIVGGIVLFIIVLDVGYYLGVEEGKKPTIQQIADNQKISTITTDLVTISQKYGQLYTYCENKYDMATKGDYVGAIRLNGQMDGLLNDINTISSKYDTHWQSQ
jgi:hypothetical protein